MMPSPPPDIIPPPDIRLIYGGVGQIPPAAASTAIVLHDADDDWQNHQANAQAHRPTHTIFVEGIRCDVRTDRSEIVSAAAPPFNALFIKYFGEHSVLKDIKDSGFRADHHFVRREPQPGEGGNSAVRRVFAMCEGCVARGWHLPDTDITCAAYGVPIPKPYTPGRSSDGDSSGETYSKTGTSSTTPSRQSDAQP